MRNRIGRLAAGAALTVALSGIYATAASATVTLTPATADFGSYPIGVTAPTKTFTLTVTAGDPFQTNVSITNPDWSQTNNCPTPMMGIGMTDDSCTITVTFKPIVVGPRGGLINTGSYGTMPPPPFGKNRGPVAEAFGRGLFNTPPEAAPVSVATTTPVTTSTKKKKCKRKHPHGASAAKKKCKKRK